jgi:hypothetical protein
MYSIPANKDTYGSTERIIGTWLKNQAKRSDCFGSKLGPNPNFGYMREKLDFAKSIKFALDESLNDCKPIILMYTNCTGQSAKRIILGNAYTVQEDVGR